jgi:hypothetical protein
VQNTLDDVFAEETDVSLFSCCFVAPSCFLCVQLSSFWESHFLCPICLGEITHCVLLRGCSHQFCRSCVSEALNRRHACPLCLRDAEPATDIQPNPAFDQLAANIRQAQRVAAAKLTKKLLHSSGNGGAKAAAAAADVHDEPGAGGEQSGGALPAVSPALVRAASSQQALSPMESLFRTHVAARVLLPWEVAFQELQQEARQTEERATAAAAASAASAVVPMSDADPPVAAAAASAPGGLVVPSADTVADNAESLQQQLAYFPRATHALVSAYETFLLQQPPPSFLEPVRVTVTLEPSVPPAVSAPSSSAAAAAAASGSGSASSLQLRFTMRAYDDFGRLLDRIVAESRAPEHSKAWALRCINLESQQPFAASAFAVGRGNVAEFLFSVSDGSGGASAQPQQPQQHEPVSLEVSPALRTRSFASLSIHGGSQVSLRIVGGSSTLQFLVPPAVVKPRCFMHTYRIGDEQQQRVDYFKCAPCGLNWLCKNCAATCHSGAGHAVAPFIMGHKPTYAACYCNKKRHCTLKE